MSGAALVEVAYGAGEAGATLQLLFKRIGSLQVMKPALGFGIASAKTPKP